jgi:hypothetical protein
MAFDPDEFIKNNKQSTAADSFDPDKFIKNTPDFVPGAEPVMVADVPASGLNAPGTPMATPPDPSAVPQLPVTGYGPGMLDIAKTAAMTTPMGQNVSQVLQPYASTGSKILGQYAANPFTKLAPDLASVAAGFPPPYATSQAIGATQGAYNVARKLPPAPAPVPVNPMMQTEFGQEIARRAAAAEAEKLANRSVIQKIAMSKVVQNTAKVAAPVLNTVGKVAGPAGLAYNLYEAGNMARETQLGERLAQGQGQVAQKQFRNMNPGFATGTSPRMGITGFNETLTADQAREILASKNTRDIQAFGGLEFLRKKALGQ